MGDLIDYLRDLWDEFVIPIIVGGLLLLVVVGTGALIYLSIKEDSEWERFKVAHKCKVVGHGKGTVNVGIDGKGKTVVIPEADKVSWLCDDGITYTR